MNVNFGLFPEITEYERVNPETGKRWRGKDKGRAKKRAMSARALMHIESWIASARHGEH